MTLYNELTEFTIIIYEQGRGAACAKEARFQRQIGLMDDAIWWQVQSCKHYQIARTLLAMMETE